MPIETEMVVAVASAVAEQIVVDIGTVSVVTWVFFSRAG